MRKLLRFLDPVFDRQCREIERQSREAEIRHAWMRAELTAWEIEVWHYLREGNSDR
jgi:hypothetical protein